MEEKFSVSLELMIQKFKDGAKKAQEVSQNVASKIKENMSVDVGSNAFKGMNVESELLLNKINSIKATLQMANDNPKLLPKQDILEMNAELEKLEGQYNKINQSSNMFSSSFNKIKDGMNESLKSAKRFTLSLFGIQSVYRMLSRASSAYLAQDEETSSKIQSAWIGLGSVFAPLLQTIANFAIKAVSYINVFIKALTGTDFLANAMAKSMNKAGKSAGKLSKILAGFDELTNLDDDAGGASVDTSWIDAFKNVKLDPSITNFFQKLGEAMKPVYEGVIKLIDWFKQLDTTTQMLVLALGVTGLLGLFFGPVGLITGIGLLTTGLFAYFSNTKNAKKETDDLKTAQDNLKQSTDNLKKANDDLLYAINLYEESVKSSKEAVDKLKEAQDKTGISGAELKRMVDNGTLSFWDMTDAQKEVYKLYLDTIEKQSELETATQKVTTATDKQKEATKKQTQELKNNVDQLEIANSRIDKTSEAYKNNQTEIDKLKVKIKDLTGQNYSTSIEVIAKANTTKASNDYRNFFSRLGESVSLFLNPTEWFSGMGAKLKKIWSFDVGTDYVPNDMLAQIHKGEKIIPKKFNSDEYVKRSDANNNADVVNKIDELIDELRRKDMNAYITESSIGKASQNYRNLQSRIIGEELI
jgi:exonuclease VII small subunit